LYDSEGLTILAKIAVANDARQLPRTQALASGAGWSVTDVVCNAGPRDRPFEEQHTWSSIAVVVSGTFQYRSSAGEGLMVPGSLLLGNARDAFVCAHEHGTGDRCVHFSYSPELLARLGDDLGVGDRRFATPRLPPARALAPFVAAASTLLANGEAEALTCETIGLQLAARVMTIDCGLEPRLPRCEPAALKRVSDVVRLIECDVPRTQTLRALADAVGLSPYHFLRTFSAITGTTPHQYILRVRLRRAAVRLRVEEARILDVALDCGFDDLSNFNRAFRAEFGASPRGFQKLHLPLPPSPPRPLSRGREGSLGLRRA
jgi:AraC family transcriptional regulator